MSYSVHFNVVYFLQDFQNLVGMLSFVLPQINITAENLFHADLNRFKLIHTDFLIKSAESA
ncbi:hypothetical protein AR687_13020 [Flavobacteriaceae bacterium CRH]|nr:hypothetical protein AR687_13020 [Flavobacteriaceae bacterium CRH]